MTIRTLIEVTGDSDYEFKNHLQATLDKLGFQPKPSEDELRYQRDMYEALRERGIDAWKMVEEYRSARFREAFDPVDAPK